jgi:hypothetical protein
MGSVLGTLFGGLTSATNFPTVNAAQPQLARDTDGFLAKVDPTGSQLVYSTYLGGSAAEQVYGLAVDATLRAYVVGETLSMDFPATANALPERFAGAPCLISSASPFGNPMFPVACGDGFVTQFDREGNLAYSTCLSGSNTDSVNAIATSGTNVWLAGATRSSDFPTAGASASDNRAPAVCVNAHPLPARRIPAMTAYRQPGLRYALFHASVAGSELRQSHRSAGRTRGRGDHLRQSHQARRRQYCPTWPGRQTHNSAGWLPGLLR